MPIQIGNCITRVADGECVLFRWAQSLRALPPSRSVAVAEMIRGKTPEEIRKHFNIKNDFTPEEEEQVRRENEWCEEA